MMTSRYGKSCDLVVISIGFIFYICIYIYIVFFSFYSLIHLFFDNIPCK